MDGISDKGSRTMRVDVIGRGVELTYAIRSYADNKTTKLTKYFDGLLQVTVTLSRKNAQHTADYVVELVLDVAKHDNRFSALVLDVVKSKAFQMNMKTQDAPAATGGN